ncbi:MAG: DUF998 domain-containing protein [Bacteroidia bacterium]|nr:DUF998 domain-containing protein [Bacteroidia bacterium]
MKNIVLFRIAIIGVTLFVVASILGGFQFEDYSIFSMLISESMAIDTPYGWILRYFFYVPSGILIVLFSLVSIAKLPSSRLITIGLTGFAIFYGLGTIIVGFFPCDAGCNKDFIDPSVSQVIHNISGLLTYTLAPVFILLTGFGFKGKSSFSNRSILTAILSIVFIVVMFSSPDSGYVGLVQRIIETLFISWIIGLAYLVKRTVEN